MASSMLQSMLRLPPILRYEALSRSSLLTQSIGTKPSLNPSKRRAFSNTSRCPNKAQPAKPPPRPRPNQNTPPPPPPPPRRPTLRSGPFPNNPSSRSNPGNSIRALLRDGASQVLLYRAPSHTTFYLSSYILGGSFIYGAFNVALLSRPSSSTGERRIKWYVSVFESGVAIILVIFGTMFALAPWRMIRSISLIAGKTPSSSSTTLVPRERGPAALLRLEIKSPLPIPFIKRFRNSETITVPAHDVYMTQQITAQGLGFYSVRPESAAAFTEFYTDASAEKRPRPGILARLVAFNRSLVNIWPAVMRDTRRLFLRDGMAYVRVEGHSGEWKLDMQECQVLDHAKPLGEIMVPDSQRGGGWRAWVRALVT